MGHAVLGPSGAERWLTCPGSVPLSAGIIDLGSNAANEGTCYHFLASVCLTENKPAAHFIGNSIHMCKDGDCWFAHLRDTPVVYKLTVNADNADYVQKYIDNVRNLAQDNLLYVEQALPIDHLTDEENAKGTGDAIILNIAQGEIIVVDLKFGRGVEVDAHNNPQLMMYGLGALEKFDSLGDFNQIRLVVHQPRINSGLPKEFVVSRETLLEFGLKVRKGASAVWAAIDTYNMFIDAKMPLPDAWIEDNFIVSEDACRFCKGKAKCPQIANFVADMAGIDLAKPTAEGFVDETSPVESLPPETNFTPRKVYTLSQKRMAVPIVEAWARSVCGEVESELLSGVPVEGFKLVQGKRGNRQWDDPDAVEAVLKRFRVKEVDKYNMSLKTPPQLEKTLGKVLPKKWEQLAVHITQADGGLSVALESDPRPAASPPATSDGFEDNDLI